MVRVTDHEHLDLPEELIEHADDAGGRSGRSLGVRIVVTILALAMILMTVGVWLVQADIIFPM